MEKRIQSSRKYIPGSVDNFRLKECVGLFLWWSKSRRNGSAIVFCHAIFPFEKIRDRLRLDTNFHTPETGKEQIHLIAKPARRAEIFSRTMRHQNFPAPQFEQSPAGG